MSYYGPVNFVYRGDQKRAQSYTKIARALIGIFANVNKSPVWRAQRVLRDGAVISINAYGQGAPDSAELTTGGQEALSKFSVVIDVTDVTQGQIEDVLQYQFAYCKEDGNYSVQGPTLDAGVLGNINYVAGAWVCAIFISRTGEATERLVFPVLSNRSDLQPGESDTWKYVPPTLDSGTYLSRSLDALPLPRYEIGLENATIQRFENKVTQFMPWMPKGALPYNAFRYSGFNWSFQGFFDSNYDSGDLIFRDNYLEPIDSPSPIENQYWFNMRFVYPSVGQGGGVFNIGKPTDGGYESDHKFYTPPESVSLEEASLPFKLDATNSAADSDWYTSYSTVVVETENGGERMFAVHIDASNTMYVWPIEARGSGAPDPTYAPQAIKTNVADVFVKSQAIELPDGFVTPPESFRDRVIADGNADFVFDKGIARYGWSPSPDGKKFATVGWRNRPAPEPISPDLGGTVTPNLYQFEHHYSKATDAGSGDPDAIETSFLDPAVLSFGLSIEITGENLEDFTISVSPVKEESIEDDIFPLKAGFSTSGNLRYAGLRLRAPYGLPESKTSTDYAALTPCVMTDEFTYRIDSITAYERGYVTNAPFALGSKPFFRATETPGFYHMDGPARRGDELENGAFNSDVTWSLGEFDTWYTHRLIRSRFGNSLVLFNDNYWPDEPFYAFGVRWDGYNQFTPPNEFFEQAKRFTFDAELVFVEGAVELARYTVRKVKNEPGKTRVFHAQITGLHLSSVSWTAVCKESAAYCDPENYEAWGPTRAFDLVRVPQGPVTLVGARPRVLSERMITEISTEVAHIHNGSIAGTQLLSGEPVSDKLLEELDGVAVDTAYKNFACMASSSFEQLFCMSYPTAKTKQGEHFMNEVRRTNGTFTKEPLGDPTEANDAFTYVRDTGEWSAAPVELRPMRIHFNNFPWGLELYNYYARQLFIEDQSTLSLYSQADQSIYTCAGRVIDRTSSISEAFTNKYIEKPVVYSEQVDAIIVNGTTFTHRELTEEAFPSLDIQDARLETFEITQTQVAFNLVPWQMHLHYSFITDPFFTRPTFNDEKIWDSAAFVFQPPTYNADGSQVENELGRYSYTEGNLVPATFNPPYMQINPVPPATGAAAGEFPYLVIGDGNVLIGAEQREVMYTRASLQREEISYVLDLDSSFTLQYSCYGGSQAPNMPALDAGSFPRRELSYQQSDYCSISYSYLR